MHDRQDSKLALDSMSLALSYGGRDIKLEADFFAPNIQTLSVSNLIMLEKL